MQYPDLCFAGMTEDEIRRHVRSLLLEVARCEQELSDRKEGIDTLSREVERAESCMSH